MSNEFLMRRERDIKSAVTKHFNEIKNFVEENPQPCVNLRTKLYWSNGETTGLKWFDKPKYVLQETLDNKCCCLKPFIKAEKHFCFNDILVQFGRAAAISPRLPNLPINAEPLAITIVTETNMAIGIVNKKRSRHFKGIPVLLGAGRTSNGNKSIKMHPLWVDDPPAEFRYYKEDVPTVLVEKIEAMHEVATDFLGIFYDAFRSGIPPTKKVDIAEE